MKKTHIIFGITVLFLMTYWLISTPLVIISFASEKPYYIVLPNYPATHIKLSLFHYDSGMKEMEHRIKLMEIPENNTITYRTTVQKLNYIGVYAQFYNKSLNGYEKVGTESFNLEFIQGP